MSVFVTRAYDRQNLGLPALRRSLLTLTQTFLTRQYKKTPHIIYDIRKPYEKTKSLQSLHSSLFFFGLSLPP